MLIRICWERITKRQRDGMTSESSWTKQLMRLGGGGQMICCVDNNPLPILPLSNAATILHM